MARRRADAAVVGGVICLMFGIPFVWDLIHHFAAKSWVATDARVVEIVNKPRTARMTYEYVVQGQRIRSDKFAFLTAGTIGDKAEMNERFAVGDKIVVFVNPSNPKQSVVVRRELRIEYVWQQLLIVVFCGAMALWGFRRG